MPNLEKSIEFMRVACDEWSLGYDQYQRWNVYDGGECDCSSLVITALKKGGFDVGTATYTGNMSSNLTRRGWKRLSPDISKCQAGDILLNDSYHVCMVISGKGWNARIAQASIDERGCITGGRTGDQTGHETNTRSVYTYSKGWNCILRYENAPAPEPVPEGKIAVDGYLGYKSIFAWQKQLNGYCDGIVSGQDAYNRPYLPALVSVDWSYEGSYMVELIQAKLAGWGHGIDIDGYLGPMTVRALQKQLVKWGYSIGKAGVDGYLGYDTAKAVQQSINDKRWA